MDRKNGFAWRPMGVCKQFRWVIYDIVPFFQKVELYLNKGASDCVGFRRKTSLYVGSRRIFLSVFFVLFCLFSIFCDFFGLVFGFFLSSVLFLQFWFREPLVFDCMFGFDHWFGFVLGQAALERTLCGDLRYPWRLQVPTPLLVELFGFFADSLVHWSAWIGEYCVWID